MMESRARRVSVRSSSSSPANHRLRLGTTALVLIAIVLAAAVTGLAQEPVRKAAEPQGPQVIVIEAAHGPPELSCSAALARFKTDKPPTPPRRTRTPVPPDTTGMVRISVNRQRPDLALLPGGKPDQLPLQPLQGTEQALAKVAEVMRRAAAKQPIRLTFFGASHTEADFWTGRIRRIMQGRYGDRGHGFVMPAPYVSGYRASDIKLCLSPGWRGDWAEKRRGRHDGLLGLGLSASAESADSFGWIESTADGLGSAFSQVDIFTLGQPGGGTLLVQVDQVKAVAIATQSDHHRFLQTQLQLPSGPHRVKVQPRGDGEARVLGMSVSAEGNGVIVDAVGIRGATAASWLEWDERLLQQGLAALGPDLLVLAYGTNEASHRSYSMNEYRQELRQVVARLRQAQPEAACILVGPSDRGVSLGNGHYAIWDRTSMVAEVQRQVAAELGCAFWDWQQATGGPGSMVAWYFHQPRLAAGDLIHHSRAGYELVADRFVDALDAVAQRSRN